ncbi:MAG TPA: entericidin A/B family lipoprotein [Sphingomonas sp.]|jgi:predicted small secreted protein|nr:entericidin A/B family lipoprotein [Sphingomonas sp.]
MIRKFATIALLGTMLATAACNTVRGAGKDVQSVGEAVEKTTN